MDGTRRGLIIAAAVLGSLLVTFALVFAGVVAVTLIHRSADISPAQVARAVDDEVRIGGVTGATPARCPSGLRAEVGRSVRCSVTVDGQPVDVIIEVASVPRPGGREIGYGIRLEPNPIPKVLLERRVGAMVGASGIPVEATTCAGDLPPVLGQRTSCTVTSAGAPLGVAVVTTGIDGGMIRFGIGPS
jgi:hypothetical protein